MRGCHTLQKLTQLEQACGMGRTFPGIGERVGWHSLRGCSQLEDLDVSNTAHHGCGNATPCRADPSSNKL